MTNAELVKQVKAFAPATGAEVERRLERLEQCEADYKRCCELNERLCHEVHDLKAELADAARAALEEK